MYLAAGLALAVFAVAELDSPTPTEGRARKFGAILKLANRIHPRGAFTVLAVTATFFLVMGVLTLVGKIGDDAT